MDTFRNNRKEYEQNAKNQMEKWEEDLEEIIDKSKLLITPEEEEELSQKLEELSSMLLASRKSVDALLKSTPTTWDNEKVNFEKHWSHTSLTFYKVKKNLPD
ncbi:hypothetical protein [Pleomorphovibrio marinus]|uniref:hypothetical protein n=1 Tax=Pleomorphovibrio marinus TaxID=2164132 RepID=UPI000E0AEFE8|nr:hypothetical protein [Pleomorphovibrio marinus]